LYVSLLFIYTVRVFDLCSYSVCSFLLVICQDLTLMLFGTLGRFLQYRSVGVCSFDGKFVEILFLYLRSI